jgi:hypothetical protein
MTGQGIAVTNAHSLVNGVGAPCYYRWGQPAFGLSDRIIDAGNQDARDAIKAYYDGKFAGSPHYDGIYLDDMNMDMSHVACDDGISNGDDSCQPPYSNTGRCPIDPRTGVLMTEENHETYVAEFAEFMRHRFPFRPIMHNAQIQNVPGFNSNPRVARLIKASDYQEIEHGCLGPGINFTDISTRFTLFHANRAGVFHWGYISGDGAISNTQRDYGLACHLLLSDNGDYYGSYYQGFESSWFSGYETDLGAALGPFFTDPLNGNQRKRCFAGGQVTINIPLRTGTISTSPC